MKLRLRGGNADVQGQTFRYFAKMRGIQRLSGQRIRYLLIIPSKQANLEQLTERMSAKIEKARFFAK
ncbi:hypothetical protein EBB07_15245 [Paenibacillaceae bacterium]|nr:hypothetical protein EBB07_15245 [Paenibacillaceae bacterium]